MEPKGRSCILSMARVIGKVTHSHCSGLPLHAATDEKVYKPLFLDVGLMNAICGLDWRAVSQMDDAKLINEGDIAEQFVGQHLQNLFSDTPNRELTYWLRQGRSSNAELDFVVQTGGHMVPIEVKAGAAGTLKSLHQFMGSKDAPLAVRFDASLPSLTRIDTKINTGKTRKQVQYPLVSLPLYQIERLETIAAYYCENPAQAHEPRTPKHHHLQPRHGQPVRPSQHPRGKAVPCRSRSIFYECQKNN